MLNIKRLMNSACEQMNAPSILAICGFNRSTDWALCTPWTPRGTVKGTGRYTLWHRQVPTSITPSGACISQALHHFSQPFPFHFHFHFFFILSLLTTDDRWSSNYLTFVQCQQNFNHFGVISFQYGLTVNVVTFGKHWFSFLSPKEIVGRSTAVQVQGVQLEAAEVKVLTVRLHAVDCHRLW